MDALNPTLHRLLSLCRLDRTWTRGDGAWLADEHGRRFLDCYAQYGAVLLGHNAPPVVAAARAALDAGELARLTPGLSHCVFTTSGAETVEAAVKLVRGRSGRPLILSARGSDHGKTLAALAATGQGRHAAGFGPWPAGFAHVPFGDADALADRLRRDAARTAAVLLEPIQGERGVHPAPPGYLRSVRELCTRHGVALILDEIQTGLGRTGRLFACESEGVTPDLLLLAKGLGGGLFPLGACLVASGWWDDRFGLSHSSTFANNNVACRVGRAVLATLTGAGFLGDVARKGERLLAGLRRLAERHPRVVAAVRGRGLLAAVELRPHGGADGTFLSLLSRQGLYAYAVAAALAEDARLLLLPTLGARAVLRFSPPLTIRDAELDAALDGLASVCARLDRNPAQTVARALGAFEQRHVPDVPFLPPPTCRSNGRARYAFLMHPTRLEDLSVTNPGLERLSAAELRRFGAFIAGLPPCVVLRVPPLRSATGAVADGLLISVPYLPDEMARRGPKRVGAVIAAAVDLAARCGARVVGLGGHTTAFSRRGRAVVGRGPAITTGNALTAGMAFAAVCRALEGRTLELSEVEVAVVGARGSVGGLCACLFARARPRRLLLVSNPERGEGVLLELARELSWAPDTVRVRTDPRRLADCSAVVTATGAAQPVLDDVPLSPGTIVCDVARPPDCSARLRARPDLVYLDGGLVAWPDPRVRLGAGNLVGLPDGVQLACLSETVLLTLEGDGGDHGIGDAVPLEEVDFLMALAARHGFRLAPPTPRRTPRPAPLLPTGGTRP
jgi:acetylornithine/succinyldiaminopimelate/putrescine aminotransferase/predicted amino acid dehydrogenase